MLKTLVCGTGNFPRDEEEDDPWKSRTCKSNHHHNKTKSKSNNNPYSNRGLDTFASVLAELDERRRKIYQQLGSPDASLVRFGYTSSRDWVPIVVKLKEKDRNSKSKLAKEKEKPAPIPPLAKPLIRSPISNERVQVETKTKTKTTMKKKSLVWSMVRWRTPHLCLLVVVIVILVCLLISGKSFAIICTSVWWYMMPTMKENELNWRRTNKKKVYGRFLSEKKMVSSNAARGGPVVGKCFNRGFSNKGW